MRFSKILWPLALGASVFIGSMSLVPVQAATNNAATAKPDARQLERQKYAQAQKALNAKNKVEYHRLVKQLQNYPLLPYLEYQELTDRLITLPTKEVERFFKRYPDSFLSERLTHRWLRTLAQRERWADYQKFYDNRLTDPELACLSLRAQH
jgi:soluble lytic murein transglycosylase